MTLRKWFYLFWSTLCVGAVSAIAAGFMLQWSDPELANWDWVLMIFHAGTGMMFSVISQMGFFAYLILNYFAKGTFRRRGLWNTLQWILIGITFFDLIYFPNLIFDGGESWLEYAVFPLLLLAGTVGVAAWKSELTERSAFTPTCFFMFCATALEAVPALRENNASSLVLMAVPLFFCNAWQILQLHRLVGSSGEG